PPHQAARVGADADRRGSSASGAERPGQSPRAPASSTWNLSDADQTVAPPTCAQDPCLGGCYRGELFVPSARCIDPRSGAILPRIAVSPGGEGINPPAWEGPTLLGTMPARVEQHVSPGVADLAGGGESPR